MFDTEIKSNYELIRGIGKGGSALVELVRHKITNEEYARKSIYSTRRNSRKIKKEIDLQKKIDHPNVVKIVDVEETYMKGCCYMSLIMEYAEKIDLRMHMNSVFEEGKWFTEQKIIEIILQISQGIESIHAAKIAHSDIKPSNILVFSTKDT